jgi:hypothetical protein
VSARETAALLVAGVLFWVCVAGLFVSGGWGWSVALFTSGMSGIHLRQSIAAHHYAALCLKEARHYRDLLYQGDRL